MKKEPGYRIAADYEDGLVHELMQKAFFSLRELVIIDDEARLVYFSEDYAENMGIDPDSAIGKPITEVIPDSVMPSVLKSGKPTSGAIYSRNGNTMLVNRTPIKDKGRVIGVVAESIITSGLESEEMNRKLSHLTKELNYYKDKYTRIAVSQFGLDSIVGSSGAISDLKEMIRSVAPTRSTVLLTGESGTGKEVFAGAIHSLSTRREKPFIKLNCAAIPDTLLESELFGYVEGAFTGAVKGGKIGDFEAADGGTIFLDEVDSLSPNMQAKLLRVIQEREIKKIGGTRTIPIDVRFIFATNTDLYQAVKEDRFREDFYYRINVINLNLPSLRERKEDIPLLAESFVRKYSEEMGKPVEEISAEALTCLEQYDWPGNIRELENCIERALIYARDSVLRPEDIHLSGDVTIRPVSRSAGTGKNASLKDIREQAEKTAIEEAIAACGGNKAEAARELGIDRSILYDKIRKYGL